MTTSTATPESIAGWVIGWLVLGMILTVLDEIPATRAITRPSLALIIVYLLVSNALTVRALVDGLVAAMGGGPKRVQPHAGGRPSLVL